MDTAVSAVCVGNFVFVRTFQSTRVPTDMFHPSLSNSELGSNLTNMHVNKYSLIPIVAVFLSGKPSHKCFEPRDGDIP